MKTRVLLCLLRIDSVYEQEHSLETTACQTVFNFHAENYRALHLGAVGSEIYDLCNNITRMFTYRPKYIHTYSHRYKCY